MASEKPSRFMWQDDDLVIVDIPGESAELDALNAEIDKVTRKLGLLGINEAEKERLLAEDFPLPEEGGA